MVTNTEVTLKCFCQHKTNSSYDDNDWQWSFNLYPIISRYMWPEPTHLIGPYSTFNSLHDMIEYKTHPRTKHLKYRTWDNTRLEAENATVSGKVNKFFKWLLQYPYINVCKYMCITFSIIYFQKCVCFHFHRQRF